VAKRLGANAAGAAVAAAAFAVSPLVIKWAAVPYAEIPAVFFTLAAVEYAWRARGAPSRLAREAAAALALGVAGMLRLEAFVAIPVLLVLASAGRARGAAAVAGAAILAIVALPAVAHLGVMASLGVDPAKIHYVEEFRRQFEWAKYARNLGVYYQEMAHLAPPKRDVLEAMPDALRWAGAAARAAALFLSALGGILLWRNAAGRAAVAILLLYPWIHAFWHYTDARFLLIVWPIVAIAVGRGAQAALGVLGSRAAIAAGLLWLLAAAHLYAGYEVARMETQRWEAVTGGSARDWAAKIDEVAGADAEGIYELEMDTPPRMQSGPYVAMYRRAPARFAYKLPEFFEPHVAPEAGPALLREGKRFVMTNLRFDEWLKRRVPNQTERQQFRVLFAQPGHTLIAGPGLP
jgi:hypothetical protein